MSRPAHRPARHLLILTGALIVMVLAALNVPSAMERMVLSRFESPGTESHRVEQVLSEQHDTGKQHFLLLVTAAHGDVDSPQVVTEAQELAAELEALPEIATVSSYWDDRSPAMRSRDGAQALITARLAGDVTQGRRALAELSPEFTRDGEHLRVQVGGGDEIFRQAASQARTDFVRAELIILPLVFVLLVALRRGIVGAALTLTMGLFSVVSTLAVLGMLTRWVDISTFAANLVLVMGIGLGSTTACWSSTGSRRPVPGEPRWPRPLPSCAQGWGGPSSSVVSSWPSAWSGSCSSRSPSCNPSPTRESVPSRPRCWLHCSCSPRRCGPSVEESRCRPRRAQRVSGIAPPCS